ncbi:putative methyltransferase At1g27930 [Iris pallida]|uniref:Methyltransferase At1g27930 n=1 Tax=Iris pallida TaxID=29817 RepID=A0AAX6ERP8_IRIPA|nr:putative methyltransferase At1g27930 [Iris pallida]
MRRKPAIRDAKEAAMNQGFSGSARIASLVKEESPTFCRFLPDLFLFLLVWQERDERVLRERGGSGAVTVALLEGRLWSVR